MDDWVRKRSDRLAIYRFRPQTGDCETFSRETLQYGHVIVHCAQLSWYGPSLVWRRNGRAMPCIWFWECIGKIDIDSRCLAFIVGGKNGWQGVTSEWSRTHWYRHLLRHSLICWMATTSFKSRHIFTILPLEHKSTHYLYGCPGLWYCDVLPFLVVSPWYPWANLVENMWKCRGFST